MNAANLTHYAPENARYCSRSSDNTEGGLSSWQVDLIGHALLSPFAPAAQLDISRANTLMGHKGTMAMCLGLVLV